MRRLLALAAFLVLSSGAEAFIGQHRTTAFRTLPKTALRSEKEAAQQELKAYRNNLREENGEAGKVNEISSAREAALRYCVLQELALIRITIFRSLTLS